MFRLVLHKTLPLIVKNNVRALTNLQHFGSIEHRSKCSTKLYSKLQSLDAFQNN